MNTSLVTSNKKEFDSCLAALVRNKLSFSFEQSRGKIMLYNKTNLLKGYDIFSDSKKKKVVKDNLSEDILTQGQVISFFGMVQKYVNSFISSNDYYIPKLKRLDHYGVFYNRDLFGSLNNGDYFWAVDIDNSYWQGMYKLGILNRSVYDKYYRLHNIYKRIKAMSIGFCSSERKRKYYKDGKILLDDSGNEYQIKEDKWQWNVVFENVRTWSYNTIFDCVRSLGGRQNVLKYNVDCICFLAKDKQDALLYFRGLGLDFKLILCRKLSDKYYSYDDEIKTF